MFEIFGFFLILLIGVEMLETIKAYLSESVVYSEIVLEVTLIEFSRKVITLEVKAYEPLTLIGIAALIVTIALAYFFYQKTPVRISGKRSVHQNRRVSTIKTAD